MVGLGASLSVLLSDDLPPADRDVVVALCALTMLLAWLILHVGYARRYERDYHQLGGHGLDFPETPSPQFVDFLYFAVTLGTTFATSDVDITRRRCGGPPPSTACSASSTTPWCSPSRSRSSPADPFSRAAARPAAPR